MADASAAAEIVLQGKSAAKFTGILGQADWVIAPYLYIAEISHVFWKYRKFGHLDSEQCETRLEQCIALPDDFISEQELYREAFHLSCQLGHPVYDCLYLVLARRNNALLLSMDKKLLGIVGEMGLKVIS